jgi:hypothetical protein
MFPMNDMGGYGFGLGVPTGIAPLIGLLVLWSVIWKGLGLWHSAKRGEKWWFIAILVLNTAGILEILYLFAFAKLKVSELFSMFGEKKDETVVVKEEGN